MASAVAALALASALAALGCHRPVVSGLGTPLLTGCALTSSGRCRSVLARASALPGRCRSLPLGSVLGCLVLHALARLTLGFCLNALASLDCLTLGSSLSRLILAAALGCLALGFSLDSGSSLTSLFPRLSRPCGAAVQILAAL